MKLFVVMAQRKQRYEGEYGLEALAVMSEADQEQNPQYLEDVIEEHRNGGNFEAVSIIRLDVSENAVRAILFPEDKTVPASVLP